VPEGDICSDLFRRGKSGHRRGVFPNLRANGSSCIGNYMVWKVPQRPNSAMIIREKNSFIVPRWKVSAVLFLAERHSSNRNVLVNPRWCKWVGSASAEGSCLSQRAISGLERYMSRHRIRLITSGFKYYFFRYIVWQFFLLIRWLRGGGYREVLRGKILQAP